MPGGILKIMAKGLGFGLAWEGIMDGNGITRSRGMPHGFTLMELLVVITIICLLMSITLPSLTRAREQGKRVICLSNMRSLTQCWMMYALENDDRLCSADTGWDVPPDCHWVADGPNIPGNDVGGTAKAIMAGMLWPYTGESLGLYRCKSDMTERLRSFAISRTMNGQGFNPTSDGIKPFYGWSEVTQASERLVFIDADSRTPWMEGSFRPITQIDVDEPRWLRTNICNITARHSDGCNASFADGHLEYWRYKDPRTISLANYEIEPADASEYNPDLERMVHLLDGRRRIDVDSDE
jgi:prepilin-type N-terminal cleavage/methylation domain-containing protein/prepilin-type processing-associated H-X9-DG protein